MRVNHFRLLQKKDADSQSDEALQDEAVSPSAADKSTANPDKYSVAKPTDVRFYVQGNQDFFRVIGGVPDGVYLHSLENNGDGTYTMGVGGLSSGDASGRQTASFGLAFQSWRRVADPENPNALIYDDDGPRLTIDATFAKYDTNDYYQSLTLSTQQIQGMFGGMVDEGVASLNQAAQGNLSDLFTLGDTWDAMMSAYDPSQDVLPATLISEREVLYYNVGFILSGGDEKNIYRDKNLVFLGSYQIGAGASLMGFGGSHFVGIAFPYFEASVVRANWRGLQADWIVNAGSQFFIGYDPQSFFQSGFWEEERLMGGLYAGTGLRITTNLFNTKDVPSAVSRSAKSLYEDGIDINTEEMGF